MTHAKTNIKPISRDYAVTSDNDPSKDQQKPISRDYAVTSDDGPRKDQQKTNIQGLCRNKR